VNLDTQNNLDIGGDIILVVALLCSLVVIIAILAVRLSLSCYIDLPGGNMILGLLQEHFPGDDVILELVAALLYSCDIML